MKIKEILNLLDAELVYGEKYLDNEIVSAFTSDMMSDVLAYVRDQSVLVTGLVNPQVIRTANMMDMLCVIFVRGKRPTEEMLDLAKNAGIALLCTDKRAFDTSGILYSAGLNRK